MTLKDSNITENYNSHSLNFEYLRNTEQYIMPAKTQESNINSYNIYPSFKIQEPINIGYESLGQYVLDAGVNFILDGYGGVQWEIVRKSLDKFFISKEIEANWIPIENCLKSEKEVDQLISFSLGDDDPLFGRIYSGELKDFYDEDKLADLVPDKRKFTIVYGCGAALVNWTCPIIYFDVPKNEIQFRSRAGKVKNLGARQPENAKAQYKRFYFVDWVVFNKHKHALMSHLDVIVDEQRPDEITWMSGQNLHSSLNEMSSNTFRARPWFEPGVWGGQWIKNNIEDLNKEVVNYAWSFELIAPENGIVMENNGNRLEISIDSLLYHNNMAILGKAAKRFGHKFPIRFDFLDTIDGDNLSLQCHPTVAYTKENFGEDFTQDETYYILQAKSDAKVYLGFCKDINKDQFKHILEDSFNNSKTVDIEKYVQTFPAKKHDLFLIPNGTIHSSGKNNLVLEISATPYIFTFKMYDWVRDDLSGNPRTLNIDRAFDNLNFDRKGDVVTDTLISKETVIKQGADSQVIKLSTHPDHFYAIERLEFDTIIADVTNDHCLVLNLVEGESITVKTGKHEQIVHYAETFIIPASANIYTMHNNGNERVKVIKAYVKDECC